MCEMAEIAEYGIELENMEEKRACDDQKHNIYFIWPELNSDQ